MNYYSCYIKTNPNQVWYTQAESFEEARQMFSMMLDKEWDEIEVHLQTVEKPLVYTI